MKLHHEADVLAPIDRVWANALDPRTVANAFPGGRPARRTCCRTARRRLRAGHDVVLVSHAPLPQLPSSGSWLGVRRAQGAAGVTLVGVDGAPSTLLAGPAARALRRGDVRGLNRTRSLFADLVSSVGPASDEVPTSGPPVDVVVASTFDTVGAPAARRSGVALAWAHLWPEPETGAGPMPLAPCSWHLPRPARRAARRGQRWVRPLLGGFDGWWQQARLHVVRHHVEDFTANDLGAGSVCKRRPTSAWHPL